MTLFTSQDYRTILLLDQEEEAKLREVVAGFLGEGHKDATLEDMLSVVFGN